MNTAEQRRETRRLAILQSAKEVFAERGFHTASISDVIKRASIARGTFYLYFTGKEAVFESILELAIEGLQARIIGVDMAPGAPSPSQQLHENVGRVLQYVLADRALVQLLLNHGLPPDTELAQRVETFFQHVEELIERSLCFGMTMGLVRECDPALTAAQILGAMRGGIRCLIKNKEASDIGKAAAQLIDFALHGAIIPASL